MDEVEVTLCSVVGFVVDDGFTKEVVVFGLVDVKLMVVDGVEVELLWSGLVVVRNVVVFWEFGNVVVKGLNEVVLDVVDESRDGVDVTGNGDVVDAAVVKVVFDVVDVEVVGGVDGAVVVI